jgi:glycosyltransferase involved in cell wall biosynthesis
MGYDSDLTRDDLLKIAGPVSGRIRFLPFGSQRQVADLMRTARLYAMPSIYESCGNTWIEAMASGLPVIGSTLSCGPEIVPHGQAGYCCDPANPQLLADTIIRLYTDHRALKLMGEEARAFAISRYSADAAVEKYEAFYESLTQPVPGC